MIKNIHNHRFIKFLHREYATYRPKICEYFIENVLPNTKKVLDPMAGTAPLIPHVERFHISAFFYDILPIFYYINRAKTYKVYKKLNEKKLILLEKELKKCFKPIKRKKLVISEKWIPDDILELLMNAWDSSDNYEKESNIFLKAIIIMCIRPLSSITSSIKNATWYKPGGMTTERDINLIINEGFNKYKLFFEKNYKELKLNKGGNIKFKTCDAQKIKNIDTIDTIITSPPYANRYDYVIMYAPELYFLSKVNKGKDIEELRKENLSSNIVINFELFDDVFEIINKKSPKTERFLANVKEKGKEGENDYYLRCFTKYYINLFQILDKLLDILINNGKLYIVVQNNIHRGELNEMDIFIKDYFKQKGLKSEIVYQELHSHQGTRNISADHPLVLKKHKESIIKVIK